MNKKQLEELKNRKYKKAENLKEKAEKAAKKDILKEKNG